MGIVTEMPFNPLPRMSRRLLRPPSRALGSALTALALALVGVSAGAGCADADRAFTGRWVSHVPLDSDWLVGLPELVVGHFGTAVTGVAWFLDEDGIESRICPCTFIDNRSVDVEEGRFVVSTTFCDSTVWIWRLTLDTDVDPQILTGTVEVAGDVTGDRILDVQLDLVDTFIPDEKKQCP